MSREAYLEEAKPDVDAKHLFFIALGQVAAHTVGFANRSMHGTHQELLAKNTFCWPTFGLEFFLKNKAG